MPAPPIDRLLTMTATVYRRSETTDAGGDLTITETADGIIPCFVERRTVVELREGEQVSILAWRGYFLPDFVAAPGDRIEVAGNPPRSLELLGPTEPLWDPRDQYIHHGEALLREVA
jgi:hypothetical protein